MAVSKVQVEKDGQFHTIGETSNMGFAFDYEETRDPVTGTLTFTAEVVPPLSEELLRKWNLEAYKKQPFKDATIGDYWHTFDRRIRREIERQVKKGKNPDILGYLGY